MNFPLNYYESHRIIWLDAYIGDDGEYHEFKRKFVTSIKPEARYADPLDIKIYAMHENGAPFIFVHSPENAFEELEKHQDKQVIFISSGSLGKLIIPLIRQQYTNVYSFYIFCGLIQNYLELLIENIDCLQVFNHEMDLIVRLMRDIAGELVETGRNYMAVDEPAFALDCFLRARNLAYAANIHDQLNQMMLGQILELQGPDSNSGLIGRMRTALLERGEQPLPTTYFPDPEPDDFDELDHPMQIDPHLENTNQVAGSPHTMNHSIMELGSNATTNLENSYESDCPVGVEADDSDDDSIL